MPRHHTEDEKVVQSLVVDADDSATTYAMGTIPNGAMLLKSFISVTTAYAGAADARLGDDVTPARFFDFGGFDIKLAGVYEINHGVIVTADTPIEFDVALGSGGGAMRIVVQFVLG